MRMFFLNRHARGQTSLEYILLLAVVAVVVVASFGPGGLLSRVQNSSQGYYNTVTKVIMDSDGTNTVGGKLVDLDQPAPIDGGWCSVQCLPSGYGPKTMYPACECPPPAFGGKYCPSAGSSVSCGGVTADCGTCPAGEVCTAGGCACPNNLKCDGQCCTPGTAGCPAGCNASCTYKTCPQCCSPKGSIPITNCQSCGCPPNTTFDIATNTCGTCPTCYVANATGTKCVAMTCGTNMSCDPALKSTDTYYDQCECDIGSHWSPGANNGAGACVYCPQCQAWDGTECADASSTQCPAAGNWSCSASVAPADECQCWTGYTFNGSKSNPGCSPNKCAAFSGSSNATACPGTPAPSVDKAAYTMVSTCDTTTACTASCNTGLVPSVNGTSCVASGCAAEKLSFTSSGTTIQVSFPATADGVSVNKPCGTSGSGVNKKCWEGNPTQTCVDGSWQNGPDYTACTPAASCANECGVKSVGTTKCPVSLPASTPSSTTTITEFCPSGCAGGPISGVCSSGTWTSITGAGSCLANCAAKTIYTSAATKCPVTLPGGTASGSSAPKKGSDYNITVSCPSGCQGGPVYANCYDGTWTESITTACTPVGYCNSASLDVELASETKTIKSTFPQTPTGTVGTASCPSGWVASPNNPERLCQDDGTWGDLLSNTGCVPAV